VNRLKSWLADDLLEPDACTVMNTAAAAASSMTQPVGMVTNVLVQGIIQSIYCNAGVRQQHIM
jgi:hypothetical protein